MNILLDFWGCNKETKNAKLKMQNCGRDYHDQPKRSRKENVRAVREPPLLKTVEKNHFFVTKRRSQASDMVLAGSVYFIGNRRYGKICIDITFLLVYSYDFVAILNLLMAGPEWFHRRVRIRRKS
jgi:hypothetical protein